MFKLIALRILPGCGSEIRKCLRENTFYYLCNDYVISDNGEEIRPASRHIHPLSDRFFDFEAKAGSTVVNLQAIIGMNGDGKSSLIEIILRLINNFALYKGINVSQELKPANHVCAQLHYKMDDCFYCLSETDGNARRLQLIKYETDDSQSVYRRGAEVKDEELKNGFFYTLVSNYSHYAYNTMEYLGESAASTKEDCWIHNIFHKNDGYQVPLSLHPFRIKGNIDINREKELTKPRLVRTLAGSIISEEERGKAAIINGKQVVGLRLTDTGCSKFQKSTLKEFCMAHKHTSLLGKDIERVKAMGSNVSRDEDMALFKGYVQSLKEAYNYYFGKKEKQYLFDKIKIWLPTEVAGGATSDIRQFMTELQKKQMLLDIPDRDSFKRICEKWDEYADFNLCQIQRIELIHELCGQWRETGIVIEGKPSIRLDITPDMLINFYENLGEREKCLQYILYKTISILETYESYGNPCKKYAATPFFFDEGTKPGMELTQWGGTTISQPFAKLSQDWQDGSHITLKLVQTYNYYKEGNDSTFDIYSPVVNHGEQDSKLLYFKDMSGKDLERLRNSELLPPAIYYWDLIFQTNDEKVALDSFSSGEKQRLYSESAILYHLQNINSVTSEDFHYHHVNVILEEIELYFHPEWQRSFCYNLIKLITDTRLHHIDSVNILFVTHSPYILSDIPKTNVLFIRKGLPVTSMQENTFGSNINGLLKNGFFMPSLPMGEFAYWKINVLFRKLHSGDFDPNELEQLRDDIMTIGEPTIRHQLMTLYNSYKQLNTELKSEAFRAFIKGKLSDDRN